MDNIEIKKIEQDEITSCIELEKEHGIHILNERIISEDIKKENYIYLVAKKENTVLGYIGISYVLDTADIISIVVSNKHTKMGIASKLLDNIFNTCKKLNISRIMLEVRTSNIPAQKLYEKNGFCKISVRKKYYDNIEDAYIYEKEL